MESFVVQSAEDFCKEQIAAGTPAASAIDAEYITGGGCANGSTPVGSITYNGLSVSTGCNDPTGYNCGAGNQGNHCYGIIRWYGSTSGAQSLIYTSELHCYLCDSGTFVDNEMWLLQKSLNCSQDGPCWVEGGYVSEGSDIGVGEYPEQFFWADDRSGSFLQIHYGPNVSSSDYNAYTHIIITKTGPNTYAIILEGNNGAGTVTTQVE